MNVADLYRKLKSILNASNAALLNKGFNRVNSLSEIIPEIESHGEINRLPYILSDEITEITEEDLRDVTKITSHAFWNCGNIQSVTIPEGVTQIEMYAFYGCYRIKNITMPSSITFIHETAINSCSNLENMYMHSTIPPVLGYVNAIPYNTTIHVPVGSGDAYRSATNWSDYSEKIIEDVVI